MGALSGLHFRRVPEGSCLPQSAVKVTLEGCGHPKQGHPWGRLGPGGGGVQHGTGKMEQRGKELAQGQVRSRQRRCCRGTPRLSLLEAWAGLRVRHGTNQGSWARKGLRVRLTLGKMQEESSPQWLLNCLVSFFFLSSISETVINSLLLIANKGKLCGIPRVEILLPMMYRQQI